MRDTDLYARILGVESPWRVTDVELRPAAGEVEVRVEFSGSEVVECPECGAAAQRYDTRLRRWRHLPTCQYKTILAAKVPRVRCPEHGVKPIFDSDLTFPKRSCPVNGGFRQSSL